jgi:hypothetical protein
MSFYQYGFFEALKILPAPPKARLRRRRAEGNFRAVALKTPQKDIF